MLERTAACIEPASQLFLRRLEPPVRSQRALGPSFWKNGGNQLDVPPWWPLYLKRIRASRQNEAALESSLLCPQQSRLAESSESSYRLRSRASKHARSSIPPSSSTLARTYTRSSTAAQEANLAPVVEDDVLSHVAGSARLGDTVQARNSNHLAVETEDQVTLNIGASIHSRQTEEQLQKIILRTQKLNSPSSHTDLDSAWRLFNHISDQHAYTSDIFRSLARSGRKIDQARALAAFRLIDEESRTRDDYEKAVRAALKLDDYRTALRINKRATERNMQQGCSVFLLLHAVSNQLWKTATIVWNTSLQLPPVRLNQTSPTRSALVEEIGNYRDIPHAIYQLGSRLRERAPVTMQHSGTLRTLFNELLAALVRNEQLMSIITPQGLHNLFDIAYGLGRAVPSLYVSAIKTINKVATRPDKGSLADSVYTKLRSDLPEWPPPPSTFGSLLSIHAEQGSPTRTYSHYLDEFAKFHGVADPMSFQKVLSALASQGDIDGVQQVFMRLSRAHGSPTNPSYYTPLMYAYARLGDVLATQRELQRMTDAGVEPHSYAWNILIYAYARSSQPEGASQVLDLMKTKDVKPDTYTYTTLMSISARIGDTDAVLDILEQAQQNQVKGSYELVTGLVQSYCLNEQAGTAEKVAEAATSADLQGYSTTMWNYLLRHYAFLADSQSMLRVQQQMTKLGVKADAMTHAAFMTALVVFGKTRDAVQILRTLNLSQKLVATPFHYAIILHGFAQAGDRDMSSVIYQEMVERFPRLGVSPRLAMLHLQARRNPIENERPKFADMYFEEILHVLSTEDRADRLPQPGLRRRRAVEAVPSLYVEYFVDLLVKRGQVQRAEKLLHRFETLHQSPYLHLSNSASTSVPYLTARLVIRAEKQEWEEVETTWKRILERGIQIAKRSGSKEEQDSFQNTADDGEGDIREASGRLPMQSVALPEAGMIAHENFTFSSMIQKSASSSTPLDKAGLAIIFSQRYLLEVPLNRYLHTLAVRQLQDTATALVGKLEKVGFAMSSKNWNVYMQVLTRSHDPRHWILAYHLFEEKMILSIPPWPILQRSKWIPPADSKGSVPRPVRRKSVEKRNPEQLISTYYTAVHLASVLLKAARLVAQGGASTEKAIWKVAPMTCRYIRRTPFLKDRIQGILLRGRSRRILPPRLPRFSIKPDRSGVLESKSPVDHLPAEERIQLEHALKQEAALTKSSTEAAKTRALGQAEPHHGQISRARIVPEKRQALETKVEFERRVHSREGKMRRLLQATRRDASSPRVVSDMYFGHPVVPTSASQARRKIQTGNTMYGSGYQLLVKQAQRGKRLRSERRAALRRNLRFYGRCSHPLVHKQTPTSLPLPHAGGQVHPANILPSSRT